MEIARFRRLNFVHGRMTAFWLDLWFGTQTLAVMFPALFSHTLRPNASVAHVFSTPDLQLSLQPRLTSAAASEFQELTALMPSVELNVSTDDTRLSRNSNKPPTSKDHYLVTFQAHPDDVFAPNIWCNYSPPKCKFFLWLLHKGRLRTKARLFHCHMQSDKVCPFCSLDEDCFHLFIDCSRSKSFWSFIGLDLSSLQDVMCVDQLWTIDPFQESNRRISSTVITCVLWNIWKCRNAKVFRHMDEENIMISRRCSEDLALWANRCSSSVDRLKLVAWSSFFPV